MLVVFQPGRVGIAYHSFRMQAMNLRGCGTSEMNGNKFYIEQGLSREVKNTKFIQTSIQEFCCSSKELWSLVTS